MTIRLLPLAMGIVLGATAATAEEVRVYNWSDYIDEGLLEKFEAETGHRTDLRRFRFK